MNIFDHKVPDIEEEFTTLFEGKSIKIVRIVSSDKVEPKEYCQDEDEFVVVLKGAAKLDMNGKVVTLQSGDTLYIPKETKHKVLETQKGTLWLAVHF